MLVFAKESFEACLPESMPLFEAHWKETEMYRAGRKFAPDLKRYIAYNKVDFYQFYTARDQGVLVGNFGVYLTQGMHEVNKSAIEDTWYVLPSHRKGRNAINFIKYVQQQMKDQGCSDVYASTKLTNGASRILDFLGYKHVANQYWKEL